MTKSYVAAWPSEVTAEYLRITGIEKEVHLTTFFDKFGELSSMRPYMEEEGVTLQATITNVVMWHTGRGPTLVAVVDAPWADRINSYYREQSNHKHPPYQAHVTLKRGATKKDLEHFSRLLKGSVLHFDRFGREED